MPLNFSVIIAVYNSQNWIRECLDSLITQDIGFKDNIEVIIVNDNSCDDSESIINEYIKKYPENFKYIRNDENKGPATSRNIGLAHASGNYVNFLDSDDTISKNSFKNVLKFFKSHENVDLVSIPIYFFENRKGPHYLNYKFKKTREVNLLENPQFYQLSAPSSFIKRTAVKDIKFPDIITSEDVVFINEILTNNPNIGLCCEARYNYRKRKENSSIINNSQLDKRYYTPRINDYFNYLIEKSLNKYGEVVRFIQNVIMYDISWMLKIRNIEEILNQSEMAEFKTSLKNVLNYIDDDIIKSYEFLDEYQKINAFLLK